MPLTAAMTGFHRSHVLGPMFSPGSSNMNGVEPDPTTRSPGDGDPSPMVSVRSMPVEKALSHAPPHGAQLVLHARVEGVVHLGPVHGDPGHPVLLLVQEGLVLWHWSQPLGRPSTRSAM